MPDLLVRSFAPFLLAFQSCFTQPSFRSFWALTCAWILCSGRRSLTRIIQSAQLTEFKHYCSFHRFFSQARACYVVIPTPRTGWKAALEPFANPVAATDFSLGFARLNGITTDCGLLKQPEKQ